MLAPVTGSPTPTPGSLARRLNLGDAVVIGLGSMIGAGIFASFTPAAAAAGAGLLIGLVIAGFIAYCNATSSAQLAALSGRISRAADVESLCGRRDGLAALRAEVERTYLKSLSEQEMSANDAEFERHISNSNTDSHIDNYGSESDKRQPRHASSFRIRADLDIKIPLERLLALCPDLSAYALAPLRSWQDVKKTAELVRSILGVSPDAWRKAVAAMGDTGASIVVAAILQRGEEIRSPGGYLRELTAKAEKGRFSIQPLLKALEG